MTDTSPTTNSLLKRLSRGMQALLLSLVALGATVLLWAATLVPSQTWKEFLNAVATGLLVSAAFGIAQTLLTSKVTTDVLRTSIMEEVSRSLAHSSSAYYPISEFSASSVPDPQFNTRLSQDLANSSTFWFRGMSGRYTAARLALNQNVRLQAYLILPDPRVPGTLEGRIDYANRHQLYPGLDSDEIRERIQKDINHGIVGLFEASHRCAILELILTPMPVLDRYEIFRDAIWVTLFSDPGRGTNFPRTLRFSSSSVMYLMQQADCLQIRSHPSSRLIQPRTISEADLIHSFNEITGQNVTRDGYMKLKKEFYSFTDDFARSTGLKRGE
jgi:hypothetical protein